MISNAYILNIVEKVLNSQNLLFNLIMKFYFSSKKVYINIKIIKSEHLNCARLLFIFF